MKPIILFFLLIFLTIEKPEVIQLKRDLQFKVKDFFVRDAYILSNTQRLVIASDAELNHTELRLLYVEKGEVKFKSQDVGESYIYRPTFFKFQDNSLVIVCERGFEYSLGVDVYTFDKKTLKPIGSLDLGIEEAGQSTSIVPKMTIERGGDRYQFRFTGKVIVSPGGTKETMIDGEKLKATYFPGNGEISLLIKVD